MSAISLAVGLLIPPATSVAMLIGGLVDYRLKKIENSIPIENRQEIEEAKKNQKKTSRILSGAVSGEAIVTVIFVLWNAFLFFAP